MSKANIFSTGLRIWERRRCRAEISSWERVWCWDWWSHFWGREEILRLTVSSPKWRLDQMARAYSVKGGTCRWPVAVFYNILDLAGFNAHVLFKECTSSKIGWSKFMQLLAEELKAEFIEGKHVALQLAQGPQQQKQPPQQSPKWRQYQIWRSCNQNKTQETCRKPMCGNCARRREVTVNLK